MPTDLRALDLNLLVALHALLQEHSVTRAAARVGLSQPAMSHALAKLRDELNDPLLVRAGRHMTPTELAEQLAPRVGEVIGQISTIFEEARDFDPNTNTRSFRITATDYVQLAMLPALAARWDREVQGAQLSFAPTSQSALVDELRHGSLDLAISLTPSPLPPDLHTCELFSDEFVVMARADHPALAEGLDVHTYAKLSHILGSSRSAPRGIIDNHLAQQGLERRVALVVSEFLVVPHLIASSDHIATIFRRIADPFAELLPLRLHPVPLPLETVTVSLIWHRRVEHSRAHQWLRQFIIDTARTLAD